MSSFKIAPFPLSRFVFDCQIVHLYRQLLTFIFLTELTVQIKVVVFTGLTKPVKPLVQNHEVHL